MSASGTIYHTLLKTFLALSRKHGMQVSQRLRDFEKFAKRNGIDSLVSKTGASPGLIYAEAGDLRRLQVFTTEVRQSRGARTFAPIVPPMEAPFFTQSRLANYTFPRVVDVEGMDGFGTEMSKRGLEHWWIDVSRRQQSFSARS